MAIRRFRSFIVIISLVTPLHLITWSLVQRNDVDNTMVRQLEEALTQSVDIIYLGDSVLHSVSDDEERQGPLYKRVADKLPGCRVASISAPASHAGLYKAFVDYISQHDHRPKLVIIPINLRSFGPGWSKRPSYQFHDVIRIASESKINPFYHFMEALAQSSFLSEQEYLSEPVYDGQEKIGTVGDFDPHIQTRNPSDELRANVVIMNYMYTLTEEYPRLSQLVALVETARREHIPLLLYVTPIDWEQGEFYHGDKFFEAVNRNLQLIIETLAEHDAYPLNMTFDLEHELFNYRQYINEHLYFAGREYVAEYIANTVQDQFSLCNTQEP